MKINLERLFPYPVLREENGNFNNAQFKAELNYRFNETTYEFDIHINLEEEVLIKLIEKEKAVLVCHLECSKTKFRKVVPLSIGKNKFLLDSSHLEGKLEIMALIIAKEDIKDYWSDNFDKDYGSTKFLVPEGGILGIVELPSLLIENKKENNANLATIFDIHQGNPVDNIMKIALNQERIQISLPPREYQIRNVYKNSINGRNVLNTMIVFPALVGVLNHLAHENSIDTHGDRRWFRVLYKKLSERGYSIENGDLEENSILTIAQELLGDLFTEGMESLHYLQNQEENDYMGEIEE